MKTLHQIQIENRKFILEAIHGCSYYESARHEITEIIGKPLTLSRVLLALKSKEDLFNPKKHEICLGTKNLFYYDYSKNIGLGWDLTKETLEEQSEETQRKINKLFND